jgi:type III secretion system YscD/HrpQ family protein
MSVKTVTATRPRCVLRVLAGLHRGAEIAVGARDLIVIGRAGDCDVVLADAGVAPRHVAVRVQAEAIALRALDGDLRLRGRRLGPGERLRVAPCTPFELGEARVAIGERADPFWALIEPAAPVADPRPEPPALPARRRRAAVAALAATAIALAALPFLLERTPAALPAPEARVGAVLDELALDEVHMVLHDGGRLAVEGVVPDHASHARLAAALARAGVAAQLRVLVGEEIARGVREVFRVNGLAVEARYDAGGVVTVSGFAETGPEMSRAGAHALRDVRGLAALRLEVPADRRRPPLVLAAGDAPQRAPASAPRTLDRIDPNAEAMGRGAKRITVVVQAERPYVVTADGRRYFVGSVLPHGYRVAEISGSTLRLERDGEVVVRTF